MVFSNGLLFGASAEASGGGGSFDTTLIPNSIQLNGTDEKFQRNTSSWDRTTTGGKRCVMACWVQLCKIPLTANQGLMFLGDASSGSGGTNQVGLFFSYNVNPIEMDLYMYCNGKSFIPLMAFRDVGWYHILASFDLNLSGTNTGKLFVNGIEITETRSDQRSTFGGSFNNVDQQQVGAYVTSFFPGYIAQPVMLQNHSIQNGDVAVTDFLDSFTFGTNGSQFVPKTNADIAALATSAGGNSFCLDFETTGGTDEANLGLDISDLGNNLVPPTGVMAASNQSTNTPSLVYPIFNPLSAVDSGDMTLAEGNLKVTPTVNQRTLFASMGVTTGAYYWEAKIDTFTADGGMFVGIGNGSFSNDNSFTSDNNYITSAIAIDTYSAKYFDHAANEDTTNLTGTNVFATNDIVGFAVDIDNGKFWIAKNNTWADGVTPSINGSGASSLSWKNGGGPWFPMISRGGSFSDPYHFRFASGDFSHTAPSGFKEWKSSNLTAPDNQGIDFFNTVAYTGNGGTNAITGTGFQPDLVAIKSKTAASPNDWGVYDAVRGTEKQLSFNQPANGGTASEQAKSTGLTTFGSDGFTVGTLSELNTSSANFAAYQWLGQNGTTSIGASGSRLASTVSVSAAGNFSIVSWEGSGANATVGHGLSVAPELVFYKNRETADGWVVYCEHLSSNTHFLLIDDVAESNTDGATYFNSAGPTASVLNLGSNTASGASDKATNKAPAVSGDKNMIAYCFASIAGVCKVGVYEGDSLIDGPYVPLGFTPAAIIWKNIDSTAQWPIVDNTNNTSGNPLGNWLLLDSNGTIGPSGSFDVDFLADAFKPRLNSSGNNQNTIIYLAMADIGGNGTLPPIYGR
jgi:hypothetical protein